MEDGNDRPIAYFRRKLLPREEKYSTVEKENSSPNVLPLSHGPYVYNRNGPPIPQMVEYIKPPTDKVEPSSAKLFVHSQVPHRMLQQKG